MPRSPRTRLLKNIPEIILNQELVLDCQNDFAMHQSSSDCSILTWAKAMGSWNSTSFVVTAFHHVSLPRKAASRVLDHRLTKINRRHPWRQRSLRERERREVA
jgi:hypothetical protein